MSYRKRRQEKRDSQRQALVARMLAPIPDELRQRDPLQHGRSTAASRAARMIVLTGAAATAHAVVLGCFFLVGLGTSGADAHTKDEKLQVELVETLPELEKIEEPEPEVAVKEPEPEKTAEIEAPPEEPKPEPKPRKPKPKPRVAKADPPPDPTEEPKKAEPVSDKPTPRRRIVGLNLESTTTGGAGPSFAVGTSRMGETETRALDPRLASKRPAAKGTEPKTGAAPSANRVASRIPVKGVKFESPKRLGKVVPTYPSLLKKQEIEANVVVLVTIDVAGKVKDVRIVKGAPYPEFDRAARAAALKERFAPATRNGVPVQHTIKYTYRFRLSN